MANTSLCLWRFHQRRNNQCGVGIRTGDEHLDAQRLAMPTARQGAVAVVESNTIYVIGGNTSTRASFLAVESDDPATDSLDDGGTSPGR